MKRGVSGVLTDSEAQGVQTQTSSFSRKPAQNLEEGQGKASSQIHQIVRIEGAGAAHHQEAIVLSRRGQKEIVSSRIRPSAGSKGQGGSTR